MKKFKPKNNLLSWTKEGTYQATLRRSKIEPVVVIHVYNGPVEYTVSVSLNGEMLIPGGVQYVLKDINVRLSSNAPINLTWKSYTELNKCIAEAKDLLRDIKRRGRLIHFDEAGKTLCGTKINNKVWCGDKLANCKNCLKKKIIKENKTVVKSIGEL